MRRLALLLLLLAVLSGCNTLVKTPVVVMKDLSVVSVDPAGAGMEVYLRLKNPNNFDLKLYGYSYDLKVMALPLVKGGAREEINFPANEETDVRIPIRVAYADLLEILKRKPDPDKIPYQLAAGLDLETPLGQMSVPVKHTGTYAIPKQYRPAAIFGKIADFFKF
ncbi:LEA type 2 family protein [Geomonas edaphica]|uniref:LEA type 2 family protein n=1 Tax=Geomonas edaphica TaxID=2570226 RepID=UPI0010A92596|nr:LEA type 2 family protein [Geomonas edaphica]